MQIIEFTGDDSKWGGEGEGDGRGGGERGRGGEGVGVWLSNLYKNSPSSGKNVATKDQTSSRN